MKATCAALLLGLFVAASAAQEPPLQGAAERKKALLEGTHVFRRILHDSGCTPLESFAQLNTEPDRTILIILGDLDHIEKIPGGLEQFVERGGAVLLASDRKMSDVNSAILNQVAGVRIHGGALVALNDDVVYNKVHFHCPLLWSDPAAPRSFLLTNPENRTAHYSVATNVPSYLIPRRGLPGSVRVHAYLPPGCQFESNRPWGRHWEPPPPPRPVLLVAGDVGRGRVIVAADHSIFINEMMLPDEIQNVEFADNCVRYLCDKPGDVVKRDRVLFLDEFGIQTKFDVPLRRPHLTPDELIELLLNNPDKAIALADHVVELGEKGVDRLERKDAVNDFLSRVVERLDQPPGRLFAVGATLLTVGLCFYGVLRLGLFGRFKNDVRTPLLSHAVGKNQPTGPLTQQRTLALVRTGRLNEPAAQLARRWLLAQNLGVPDETSPGEPPILFAVGWWAARGLRQRIRRIWLLAAGRSRQTITPAELWQLQRELDALAACRQQGQWTPKAKERGGAA